MAAPTKPEWMFPDYEELKRTDNVGKAAVEGQIFEYPKIARTASDPPISNQAFGLTSFMLFKEPRALKTGKKVYGFFKNRGVAPTSEAAIAMGKKIVRETDSKFEVRVSPVGAWLPITDETDFVKEMFDVDDDSIHSDAVKEKRENERRIRRELDEREAELREEEARTEDKESIEYYATKRVTEIALLDELNMLNKKILHTQGLLDKTQNDLRDLEVSHDEYTKEWLLRYNKERSKTRLPPYVPSKEHLEAHESAMSLPKVEVSLEDDSDSLAASAASAATGEN